MNMRDKDDRLWNTSPSEIEIHWEILSQTETLTLYRKKVAEPSGLFQYKARGTLPVNLITFIQVQMDLTVSNT